MVVDTETPRPERDDAHSHPCVCGTVLLALGDSIAAGIGAPHVSEGCMAVLASRLGVRLVSLAVPGETTASMLRAGGQLERAEAVIAELVRAEEVALVTLSIGGNDAMEAQAAGGDDVALRSLERNLDTIFARLGIALAAGGRSAAPPLAVQTVYSLADGSVAVAELDRLMPRRVRRGGHNAAIRQAAARAGVRVIEVSAAFRGRAAELTWMLSGDIHPRALGHRVIADAYLAAVRPGAGT